MSTVQETFYGVKCDYPDCGDVYEGEYSYWADPGLAEEYAGDSDWLIGFKDKDYCEVHSFWDPDLDGDEDEHRGRRPLSETLEMQMDVAVELRVNHAHRRLQALERRLLEDLMGNGYNKLNMRTNQALERVHTAVCTEWKPDITGQELFDLKHKKRKTS